MSAKQHQMAATDDEFPDYFDVEEYNNSSNADGEHYEQATHTTITTIPTKTGEPDHDDGTSFQDDRPSSAGTGKSIPLEQYDVDFMEENTASAARADDFSPNGSIGSKVLARQNSPQPETTFSFETAKAPKQPLLRSKHNHVLVSNVEHHNEDEGQSTQDAANNALQAVQESSSPTHRGLSTSLQASDGFAGKTASEELPAEQTMNSEPPSEKSLLDDNKDENETVSSASVQSVSDRALNPCVAVSDYRQADRPSSTRHREAKSRTMSPSLEFPNAASSRAAQAQRSLRADQKAQPKSGIQVLRRVSDQQGNVRVTKKRLQTRSREAAARPDGPKVLDEQATEIFDYLQILGHKLLQKERKSAGEVECMRRMYEAEMCDAMSARDDIEEELKHTIADGVHQREALKAKYTKAIRKLESFQTNLGKDFAKLQAEAAESNKKYEGYLEELENEQARLKSLTGRSAKLEESTSKIAQDQVSQVQATTLKCQYLEEKLSETAGMLAEERDRRSQLERQAQSQIAMDHANTEAVQKIKDEVSSKLMLIHNALEDDQRSSQLASVLDKMHAAVMSLNPQSTASAEDVASLKSTVEALSHSLKDDLQEVKAQAGGDTISTHIKRCIDEAILPFMSALGPEHEHQATADRAAINETQGRLATCHERIVELDLKIADAHNTIEKLKADNSALQSAVAASKNEGPPADGVAAQLHDLRAEIHEKTALLDSTTLDLNEKNNDLYDMTAARSTLQKEVDQLKAQVEAAQSSANDFEIEKARLYEQYKLQAEKAREDMQSHVENFEMELKTKTENDVKRLTSERDRLQRQTKTLEDELSKAAARVEELATPDSQEFSKDRELKQAKNDIAVLRETLNKFKTASGEDAALSTRCSSFSKQLNDEKSKVAVLNEENSALSKRVERLQHDAEEAMRTSNNQAAEAQEIMSTRETEIKELRAKLQKATQAADEAVARLEQQQRHTQQCEEESQNKTKQLIEKLREDLSAAQADLQIRCDEHQTFQEHVEESWQAERAEFESVTENLKQQLRVATAKNHELAQVHERLQRESVQAMKVPQGSRMEHTNVLSEYGEEASSVVKSATLHQQGVMATTNDLTPSASTAKSAPPKPPRKQIDRGAMLDSDILGALSGIVPTSQDRNTSFDVGDAHDFHMADSQAHTGSLPTAPILQPSRSHSFLSESDEMLSIAGAASQPVSRTVSGAQMEDGLPSLSAFKANLGSSPRSKLSSPHITVPSIEDSQDMHNKQVSSQRHRTSAIREQIEGSNPFHKSDGLEQLRPAIVKETQEHDLNRSQGFTRNSESQSTFAHPNSGLKRAQRNSNDSRRASRSKITDSQPRQIRSSAVAAKQAIKSNVHKLNALSSQDSSPGFVNPHTSRKLSTYHHSRKAKERLQTLREERATATDPRTLARQPSIGTKRKPESHLEKEHTRGATRRRTSSAREHFADSSSDALQSNTQQSGRGASGNTGPSSHAVRTRSTAGRSQPRQRISSQSSTQSNRGSRKKPSQNDYSARFQQELGPQ